MKTMSVHARNVMYWCIFRRTFLTSNEVHKSMACSYAVCWYHVVINETDYGCLAREMPHFLQSNIHFEENKME